MPRQREFIDVLEKAKQTCAARGKDYTVNSRDGFTVHAEIIKLLFPEGTDFDSVTAEKFVVLNYIIGKVVRYALLLGQGGHEDSAMDISVYGAILAALHPEPTTLVKLTTPPANSTFDSEMLG
jgi:hypothetical protein